MHRTLRFFIALAVVGMVTLWAAPAIHAQSAELSDEQRQRVKDNCTQIKSSLNQLHTSDALLRVNRGQVYESMAGRLMEPFNDRLDNNRLDAKAMVTVTGSYRTALTGFRDQYIKYEEKVSEALRIDCTADPDRFHATLLLARSLRNDVHENVLKLHQYIDDYRQAVGDFRLNYERISQ